MKKALMVQIHAINQRRLVLYDAYIVGEDRSRDVYPNRVGGIGNFENSFGAEDDLWFFSIIYIDMDDAIILFTNGVHRHPPDNSVSGGEPIVGTDPGWVYSRDVLYVCPGTFPRVTHV